MNYTEAVKEYFEIGSLSRAEQVEYYLINRYASRISDRLRARKVELQAKGKAEFIKTADRVLNSPHMNWLIKDLSKGTPRFYYAPVPLKFELIED